MTAGEHCEHTFSLLTGKWKPCDIVLNQETWMMLARMGLILGIFVLSACAVRASSPAPLPRPGMAGPPRPRPIGPKSPREMQVRQMIARFGPVLYLHSREKFLPDDPEYVLNSGAALCWGLVNETSYDAVPPADVQTRHVSSATLYKELRAVQTSLRSPDSGKYKYWLHINQDLKDGDLKRAKAIVRVLPAGKSSTEIQFWFFYPFNGPGRVRVQASGKIGDDNWLSQCGRHYGDWELISIIVSNTNPQLLSVYMSRHNMEEIFTRRKDGAYVSTWNHTGKLQIQGGKGGEAHPVVYAGLCSHAHYPSAGKHYYDRVFQQNYVVGKASADLFDVTEPARSFQAYREENYRIVSSDVPGFHVVEPGWLDYKGRWGQYEKLADKVYLGKIKVYDRKEVGKGPTGPKAKPDWAGAFKDPDGWIGFKHGGAYVAKFFMSWTEDGKPKGWSSGKRAVRYTERILLSGKAKNITINAQAFTGFRWRDVFRLKLQGPPNKVYVARGTTLRRKYSVQNGF